MVPKAIKAFPDKELIQYRGKAEVVSGNTVGCSLELLELCPGEARRKVLMEYGRSGEDVSVNTVFIQRN